MSGWMDVLYINRYKYTHIYTYIHTQWDISHKKKENPAICDSMDGPWRYMEWDKSDKEKQMLYCITYMRNIKKPNLWKHRKSNDYEGLGCGRDSKNVL